jgi:hypothetical protein
MNGAKMEQDARDGANVEEERLDARLSELLNLMRDNHFATQRLANRSGAVSPFLVGAVLPAQESG